MDRGLATRSHGLSARLLRVASFLARLGHLLRWDVKVGERGQDRVARPGPVPALRELGGKLGVVQEGQVTGDTSEATWAAG